MSNHNGIVARFLKPAIENDDRHQTDLAEALGFANANAISLMKNGKMKVPFTKINAIAKFLRIDPRQLLALCLREYTPEIAEILDQHYPELTLSENELDLIVKLRKYNPTNPRITTQAEEQAFSHFVSTLKQGNPQVVGLATAWHTLSKPE